VSFYSRLTRYALVLPRLRGNLKTFSEDTAGRKQGAVSPLRAPCDNKLYVASNDKSEPVG
jgi:hypothetical protein